MSQNETTVTCAYCLRQIAGHLSNPNAVIRHGFNIITNGHGHEGAWHTGPCRGRDFYHLGVSDEGTKAALADIRAAITRVEAELKRLETRPVLPYEIKSYGRPGQSWYRAAETVDVKPGDPEVGRYSSREIPSYTDLLDARIGAQQGLRRTHKFDEKTYAETLATWTVEAYAPKARKVKRALVHAGSPKNTYRPRCSLRRVGITTMEEGRITCPKCLKLIADAKAREAEVRS